MCAVPYHAGLSDDLRHKHQDAFASDQADVVVATVAFGMGVDKPDVRFVMHRGSEVAGALPAGNRSCGPRWTPRRMRDVLRPGDFITWQKMQSELTGEALKQMQHNLHLMERYCLATTCRHRVLVEHFDQSYENENCAACDACLDQLDLVADPLILVQKLLSCVVRCGERFGGHYISQVLHGSKEARILENGHDRLSTYKLLSEHRADRDSGLDRAARRTGLPGTSGRIPDVGGHSPRS